MIDPDTGQKFMIGLDDKILSDISKNCELRPEYLFVCRDVTLDDSAAENLPLQWHSFSDMLLDLLREEGEL